jgi:NADP-dependent 3-hydroxy acid dehydrogenase YdfG
MDLQISNTSFLITGATSGLGLGVSRALLKEGASIIAVGTDQEKLNHLKSISPEKVTPVKGNLFDLKTADFIIDAVGDKQLGGVFLNASGPCKNCCRFSSGKAMAGSCSVKAFPSNSPSKTWF